MIHLKSYFLEIPWNGTLRFVALLGLIGSGYVLLRVREIFAEVKRESRPIRVTLGDAGPKWDRKSLVTSDGLRLAAWYSPTRNGSTIIMLHGARQDRRQILPEADTLRMQGFGVLLYDTRGHGESEGTILGYGKSEVLDIQAALTWLEHRPEVDMNRIGAYGFSRGGFILAQEAAKDRRIASLIIESTPSSIFELHADAHGGGFWGGFKASVAIAAMHIAGVKVNLPSTRKALKELGSRPVLILAGEKDQTVLIKRAISIYEAAVYPKRLIIFPNAHHDNCRESETKRFMNVISDHFEKTLGIDLESHGHELTRRGVEI